MTSLQPAAERNNASDPNFNGLARVIRLRLTGSDPAAEGATELPDVTSMSNAEAALVYAKAGIPVVPIRPGTKNPGSYLGKGWPHRATTNADTIRDWWTRWPDAGIAMHVGGARLLVIDVDAPERVPAWLWPLLEKAVFRGTTSDPDSRRGHYLFRQRSTDHLGNGLGRMPKGWGEVRGYGGAIVLGPTAHPRAAEGGHYASGPAAGTIPLLPLEIAKRLNQVPGAAETTRHLTRAELAETTTAFFAKNVIDSEPYALDPICRRFDRTEGGRHDSMWETLCWAMREAKAGRFPAQRAADALRCLWREAIGAEYRNGDPYEFDRMLCDAIAVADNYSVDELWDRSHRDERVDNCDPVTRSLSDVEPTKVRWLWRPWLPLGKVSILEGEPDVGKSVLTLTLTAIGSTGDEWPETVVDGHIVENAATEPFGVVLVGIEDDDADTVVPRLDAAGADRSRVHTMNQPLDAKGTPVSFVIPDDVDRLRRAVIETGAKLVVIDPITAYLSTKQVKAGDDPSTRQALMPLVTLAAETGVAVLLVRHLNKATGMSAKHRGGGSIAFTGITRSVFVAGKLTEPAPGGATHAIARTKGNLSKEPMAIGYRLDSAPDDPDSPVVTWCGPIDLTADQLVGADGAKVGDARKNAPARAEAKAVLRDLLADGPIPAKDAIRKTKDNADCGIKPVQAAAKELGVVKVPVRIDGKKIDHWTWELPQKRTLRIVKPHSSDETDRADETDGES